MGILLTGEESAQLGGSGGSAWAGSHATYTGHRTPLLAVEKACRNL